MANRLPPDLFPNLGEIQYAWLRAASAAAGSGIRAYAHWLDLQSRFLCQALKYQRSHIEIATGAALTDKYGKRAHDIDPERDV